MEAQENKPESDPRDLQTINYMILLSKDTNQSPEKPQAVVTIQGSSMYVYLCSFPGQKEHESWW